jgi:hypothetical protein
LLQAQDASRFNPQQPPWVSEWLASRRERAEKKEAKLEATQAAKTAPVDPSVAAKATEQTQKREQKRWQRMQAGATELSLWLDDLMRQGLASLSAHHSGNDTSASAMAARMVDAQAPGLGQRLTQAMALIGQGPHWPERVLAQLGSLQLLMDALLRIDSLPAPVQADVRQATGWPIDKDTVLLEGAAITDRWRVIGTITLERDERLSERRVWLQGQHSHRLALVLDFSFAGQGFAQSWHTDQATQATLRFYPGSHPLRALVATSDAARSSSADAWPHPPTTTDTSAALGSTAAAWQDLATRMAANPWSPSWPLLLPQVQLHLPSEHQTAWTLRTADARHVPLDVAAVDTWPWMAQTAAAHMSVFGEWDGQALHPLSAWSPQGQWVASAWSGAV